MNADRRSELAAIHTARKDLALAEDTYRDLLERITGKRSAADLDERGRRAVIEEFRRLGWKKKHAKRAGTRALATDGISRKIRALWLSLYQLGSVRDPSENALAAYVKRLTGVDALQWQSAVQANTVIESLKSWCVREGFLVDTIEDDEYDQVLLKAVWLKRVRLADPAAQLDRDHLENWILSKTGNSITGLKDVAGEIGRWLVELAGAWLRSEIKRRAKAKS